jgi:GH15 family glucan-1,4-alpha-glucosidase
MFLVSYYTVCASTLSGPHLAIDIHNSAKQIQKLMKHIQTASTGASQTYTWYRLQVQNQPNVYRLQVQNQPNVYRLQEQISAKRIQTASTDISQTYTYIKYLNRPNVHVYRLLVRICFRV